MNSQELIKQHGLQVADVVELVSPGTTFPRHYAFYIGNYHRRLSFLANTTTGVRVISGTELIHFMSQYEIVNVERHCQTDQERYFIIRRALTKLGENDYHLLFNNCEHFKNWVLHGNSHSKQVVNVTKGLFLSGLALSVVGYATKKKGLQKAGLMVMLSPLIILSIAILLTSLRKLSDNLIS